MSYFDTHVAMPNSASAQFYTQLINWFQENAASRYEDMFDHFIVSGLVPAVPSPGSNTTDPISGEAYDNGGNYILQESTTVTFSDGDGTYWLIVTGDDEAVKAGWTRQIGTHYMWQKAGAQPALPSDSAWVADVTVAGGVITAVSDISNSSPIQGQIEAVLIDLIQNDADVALELETFVENLILTDPDIAAAIASAINTAIASLDFVAGANVGAGTGLIFRDSTGSLPETLNLKTLIAGTNMAIVNGTNDITLNATDTNTTYTAANVGGEQEVFKQLSGTQFQFRTLEGIGNVTITQNGDVLEFRTAEGIKVMAYNVTTLATSPTGSYQTMHDHSFAAAVWAVGDLVTIECWGQVISGANVNDKLVRHSLDGNVIGTANIACHNSNTNQFYFKTVLWLVSNTVQEGYAELVTDIATGDHAIARVSLSGVFTLSTDTPDIVIAAQIPNSTDTITIRQSRVTVETHQFHTTASNNW